MNRKQRLVNSSLSISELKSIFEKKYEMKKQLLALIFIGITLISTAQVENGLVAKYSFNNGNSIDETGTNHAIVSGATLTTDRFGNVNKAYSFDGVDDYITLGDVSEFQMGTSDFTISVWVYYTASQQSTIFSKRDGISSNYNMYALTVMADPQFGGASENIWGFLRSSNSNDRPIDGGVQSGVWHNIVLHHDYSDSTSIFVDGNFIGKSTVSLTGDFDIIGNPLVLGYAAEANANFYNGKIDDVRIYNRALTTLEIDSLFNEVNPNTVVDLENGLVAKYTFNNENANDESGNGNHGTINSAVLTADRFGNSNHAFQFGSGQTISVPDADTLDNFTSGMSISFWMNAPTSPVNTNPMITKFSYCGGGFDAYSIRYDQMGRMWTQIDDESGFDASQIGSISVADNNWHHVVIVWERPNFYYYVDGNLDLVASAGMTTFDSEISNSPSDLLFGHPDEDFCGGAYEYNEKLDDIRIYNRVLNTLEIDSLFNEPNPATLNISELANESMFIFPNPAQNSISIITFEKSEISIINLLGETISSYSIENNSVIDISQLSIGMYFIRNNKNGITQCLIKN
jgi:hypothetical protein